jgi:hypothetical protein
MKTAWTIFLAAAVVLLLAVLCVGCAPFHPGKIGGDW